MNFGKNLQYLQDRSGENELSLCINADFNRQTLRKWKKLEDKELMNRINRLCQELNCTPNELFSYNDFNWCE